MNKDAPRNEMSLASPLSPSALYQFLSAQAGDSGVKIKEPFTKPVLKIKPKPQLLNDEQREAWAFHLGEMHQRQVGSTEAEKARQIIDSLMKTDMLKGSAGRFMEPVMALMAAEQVRLAKASSCVRRWLANERLVQEIAIGADNGSLSDGDVVRRQNALKLACRTLEKFRDSENGEIDPNRLRDQAYAIGHGLSEEDLKGLHLARFMLVARAGGLASFIGPEVPVLIELCTYAAGRTEEEYRRDHHTKNLCAKLADTLRARTDNDEYHVPQSPRTVAQRSSQRATLPVFSNQSSGNANSFRTTPEKARGDDIPWQTHHADGGIHALSSDAASSLSARQKPDSPVSPYPAKARVSGVSGRSITLPSSVSVLTETQERQRLTHSSTASESSRLRQDVEGRVQQPVETGLASGMAPGGPAAIKRKSHARSASHTDSEAGDSIKVSSDEKRKLRRSMQYTAPPFLISEDGHKTKDAGAEGSTGSTKGRDREFRARRKAQKAQRRSQPLDTELTALQQSSSSLLTKKKNTEKEVDASQSASPAPQYDNALVGKWQSLESRLGVQLHAAGRDAVNKLLPFCHSLDLGKLDKAALSGAVLAAGISREDRKALINVRDLLLADSLKGPQAVAATVFPELLSLLVFAIDAHRSLPRL